MVQKIALALFVVLGVALATSSKPAAAGIGGCYELAPMCQWPTHPQCLCTVTQNCFWACR
jgi:hypothetical protein